MPLTKATFSMIDGAVLNVLDLGADPTGVIDSSAAIQAGVDALSNGGILFFPKGTYKIGTPIVKPNTSPYGPNLVGEGYRCTELDYSTIPANGVGITYAGTSGSLGGVYFEGLRFKGHSTSIGIEIQGQCGMLFKQCEFWTNAVGIKLHNKETGSFTEYCVADDCNFDVSCATALEYTVTSGDDSFNGSGIRNGTVNLSSGSPGILIHNGAKPYNAPLSLQAWASGGSCILVQNNNAVTPYATFHGDITTESSSTNPLILCSGTGYCFSAGSLIANNPNVTDGNLKFCEALTLNVDGSIDYKKKDWGVKTTATTGVTTVDLDLPVGEPRNGLSAFLLNVSLVGANYTYTHLLSFQPALNSAGGAPAYVTQLSAGEANNTSGWGASTFGVNAPLGRPTLTITNLSAGFNVDVYVQISQIGWYQPPMGA